jgi:hypothetical protein
VREQGGTLCELPFGLRDGFGQVGRLDDRTLIAQMQHGQPLLGGFAARIPPSLIERYRSLPVVGSLLLLSDDQAPAAADLRLSRAEAGTALRRIGVRLVLVNRSTAPTPLLAYVEQRLPLEHLATEGERELYAIGR